MHEAHESSRILHQLAQLPRLHPTGTRRVRRRSASTSACRAGRRWRGRAVRVLVWVVTGRCAVRVLVRVVAGRRLVRVLVRVTPGRRGDLPRGSQVLLARLLGKFGRRPRGARALALRLNRRLGCCLLPCKAPLLRTLPLQLTLTTEPIALGDSLEWRVDTVDMVLVVAFVAQQDEAVVVLAAALLAPAFEADLYFGIILAEGTVESIVI
mmetsp:Transcript_16441/g.38388  ORF Transcript_16441/g.38388 Transcript_16441/m.38388 type:complete len:210 (-) Transcript_16441:1760-2389(-)